MPLEPASLRSARVSASEFARSPAEVGRVTSTPQNGAASFRQTPMVGGFVVRQTILRFELASPGDSRTGYSRLAMLVSAERNHCPGLMLKGRTGSYGHRLEGSGVGRGNLGLEAAIQRERDCAHAPDEYEQFQPEAGVRNYKRKSHDHHPKRHAANQRPVF